MPDIQTVLPARSEGGSYNVAAPGDFVFVKYCDAPIKLVIDNTEPVTITTGDKRRPARRFNSFLLENPHDRPVAVVLYVGEGDFDSQIIHGEVSVVPGVRGGDGKWRDDTRETVQAYVSPLSDSGRFYNNDQPVHQTGSMSGGIGDFLVSGDGGLALIRRNGTGPSLIQIFDSKLRLVRERQDLRLTWTSGLPGNVNTGIPADVFFVRGDWYQVLGRSVSENVAIVRTRPGGSYEVVLDMGAPITTDGIVKSACADRRGRVWILMRGGRLIGLDPAHDWQRFAEYETGLSSTPAKIRAGTESDSIYCVQGSTLNKGETTVRRIDSATGNVSIAVQNHPGVIRTSNIGFAISRRFMWAIDSSDSSVTVPNIGVFAREPFTAPVVLQISQGTPACRDLAAQIWRADDGPIVEANVVSAREGDRVRVTGEVIRALVQVITGRRPEDGYLDNIFKFEYSGGAMGERPIVKSSGSVSFAAAGIADAFSLLLPANVRLVVDGGIPLADPILSL